MEIVSMDITDMSVLKLFSEHDDYMIDFLGDDKWCYTRYSANENIGKVWVAYADNLPIGGIAYREKDAGIGEMKRLFLRKEYRAFGFKIVFQQGLYIQMEKKL